MHALLHHQFRHLVSCRGLWFPVLDLLALLFHTQPLLPCPGACQCSCCPSACRTVRTDTALESAGQQPGTERLPTQTPGWGWEADAAQRRLKPLGRAPWDWQHRQGKAVRAAQWARRCCGEPQADSRAGGSAEHSLLPGRDECAAEGSAVWVLDWEQSNSPTLLPHPAGAALTCAAMLPNVR